MLGDEDKGKPGGLGEKPAGFDVKRRGKRSNKPRKSARQALPDSGWRGGCDPSIPDLRSRSTDPKRQAHISKIAELQAQLDALPIPEYDPKGSETLNDFCARRQGVSQARQAILAMAPLFPNFGCVINRERVLEDKKYRKRGYETRRSHDEEMYDEAAKLGMLDCYLMGNIYDETDKLSTDPELSD